MDFFNAKKWEVCLAGALLVLIPLADAYQAGAFTGKSVMDGLIAAGIIVVRALASHQQTPPAS